MQNTPNYNLRKPDYEDFADIVILNQNADIIDTEMKRIDSISTNNRIDVQNLTQSVNATQSILSIVGNNLNDHVMNMAQHNQIMDGAQRKQLVFGINRTLNCLTIEEVNI